MNCWARKAWVSVSDNGVVTKHIYIYSPSGAVRDLAAFKRGIRRLELLGHQVEVDRDALTSYLRFAGDDATRLSAIHRAAASGADVALISRGGYGLTRILPGIQYKKIAKSIERGTQFVGISDFTAMQLAVLAKTGSMTWAGPALCEGFGAGGPSKQSGVADPNGPDEIMEACFDDMLKGQGEGSGWRQNRVSLAGSQHVAAVDPVHYACKGTIWGGNLTMLASLVGTEFFPSVKGGILFLEDVGEHPYRIERLLTQLLHAGILSKQKAILMGQFTEFKLTPHDRGYKLQKVYEWLGSQIKVPVISNLPYGHVQTKIMLPVGCKSELAIDGRDAMLFWGHLG